MPGYATLLNPVKYESMGFYFTSGVEEASVRCGQNGQKAENEGVRRSYLAKKAAAAEACARFPGIPVTEYVYFDSR